MLLAAIIVLIFLFGVYFKVSRKRNTKYIEITTVFEATSPPETNAKLKYLGITEATCPYCNVSLHKFPLSKTKCKSCNQYMYSRTRPIDNKKVLLKEEQLAEFEEQWAINNGVHQQYIIAKQHKEKGFPVCNLSSKILQNDTKIEEIIITSKKSGLKTKQYFLDSAGNPSTTEEIVQKYLLDKEYQVIRTEVAFWQAMFAFTFWDEIFNVNKYGLSSYENHLCKSHIPQKGFDIPKDLFHGTEFYDKRQLEIDNKYEQLAKNGVAAFVKSKIDAYKKCGYWTRLVADLERTGQDLLYSNFLKFLERIPTKQFLDVVFFIALNINENRAGIPDFVAWNEKEILHVEAKRINEQIRETQEGWLTFFLLNNIKAKIIRVQGED